MKRGILVFFIALLFIAGGTQTTFAQGQAAAHLMLALPQGEFRQNVDNIGFGGSGELVWTPGPIPIFGIGIDASYMVYGNETRRAPFSETIPDVTVDVTRTNNLASAHILFKIQSPIGSIRPYADLLFGGSYLFTQTSINSTYGDKEVVSDLNFSDWAWSYGFGAGILIKVSEAAGQKIYIDLKGRYLFGTNAEYLKEGSVQIDQNTGKVTYWVSESKTDRITIDLGVMFQFGAFGF